MSSSPPRPRRTREKAVAPTNIAKMNAPKGVMGPFDYMQPSVTTRGNKKLRTFKSGGRVSHKSGGRVKGCGIAKRGLGRAMKKGRK